MTSHSNRVSRFAMAIALTPGFLLPRLLPSSPAPFQAHVGVYQAEFDKEKSAVHKAKLMGKLGDLQFAQIRADLRDDDVDRGLNMLDEYLKDCVTAHEALKDTHVDPERKPEGFKQLQVSVRANLRRLDDLLVELDAEQRKPFLASRKKLDELDRQLIHELFPRQPNSKEPE